MTRAELKSIVAGNAYLEYVGNLFEYSHMECGQLYFLNVNDGHDINFSAETILNCPLHFQYCPFSQVSKSKEA